MSYATQQNLIDRFGASEIQQLSDQANVGVINATVVAVALADADELINGYIAAKVVLPLTDVPEILIKLECDIARYYLWGTVAPDLVVTRYKAAVSILKDIAKGEFSPGLDSGGVMEVVDTPIIFQSMQKVFGRDCW